MSPVCHMVRGSNQQISGYCLRNAIVGVGLFRILLASESGLRLDPTGSEYKDGSGSIILQAKNFLIITDEKEFILILFLTLVNKYWEYSAWLLIA